MSVKNVEELERAIEIGFDLISSGVDAQDVDFETEYAWGIFEYIVATEFRHADFDDAYSLVEELMEYRKASKIELEGYRAALMGIK